MRKTVSRFIMEKARADDRIVVIIGDVGFGMFEDFKRRYPSRFFNVGICEQTMIGLAAGMALEGYKPYVYTITPFLIERPFEQIKLDVDQQMANVKLLGYAEYPSDGVTHKELNARGLMNLFPHVHSFFPDSVSELERVLDETYHFDAPCFIRLTKC